PAFSTLHHRAPPHRPGPAPDFAGRARTPLTAAARPAQPAFLRGRQSETIGARERTGGEPFVADRIDSEHSTDTTATESAADGVPGPDTEPDRSLSAGSAAQDQPQGGEVPAENLVAEDPAP